MFSFLYFQQAWRKLIKTNGWYEQAIENFYDAARSIWLSANALGAELSIENALTAIPKNQREHQIQRQDSQRTKHNKFSHRHFVYFLDPNENILLH